MTDHEPPIRVPARVIVTAAWRQEMQRRRDAYAERRKRWTDAWLRDVRPEPPHETEEPHRRRSRTIYDPRQYRFDF
jgi:hypothetical protein